MTLTELRDAWIAAENARTDAYNAFLKANRTSPLRAEFDAAERAEKQAKDAYSKALQSTNKKNDHGIDTRTETAHGN